MDENHHSAVVFSCARGPKLKMGEVFRAYGEVVICGFATANGIPFTLANL